MRYHPTDRLGDIDKSRLAGIKADEFSCRPGRLLTITPEEIAETFQVSVSWIGKLLKRVRETGTVAPELHRGGQPGAFQGEAAERLVQAVKDNPDAKLKRLALIAGGSCSTSATDSMLKKLGITGKSRYVLPNRTGPTLKPNGISGTTISRTSIRNV